MIGPRPTLPALLVAALASAAPAQLAPPMLRGSKPLGAAPGELIALEARATDVRDGATLRFDDPGVKVEGIELGPAEKGVRTLRARVTLPASAGPGPFGFRVVDAGGVSNPGRVRVGRAIPTVFEAEPNNRLGRPQVVAAPAAIEGAIAPGDDVDVFAVAMPAGETLVAEAIAAREGSRLDAYVTIYAPDGRELAANDDRFGRDAAAWATVPAAGRYLVAIQDAEGRNPNGAIEQKLARPYRLEVGRLTLATGAFPAGARRGEAATLRLLGANLPEGASARFDPPADAPLGDRLFSLPGSSNALTLRVGEAPEVVEAGPNDRAAEAPVVPAPAAINGTFERPGDVDVFRLKAEPGTYAITALAARIGSPADPVLAVLDAKGAPQGEDDDQLGRDARLERRIDRADGLLVSVRDYYGRGGPRFAYRIEVEPVRRGVSAVADLGHRAIPRGGTLLVPITLERHNFDGPATIRAEGLPEGVVAPSLTIEAGQTRGFLAIAANPDAPLGAFAPRLSAGEGPATVRCRERGPLDEVPREGEAGKGPRETTLDAPAPVLAVANRAALGLAGPPVPVEVAAGGRAEVTFTVERRAGAEGKAVKVRLLAPGSGLDRFEPVPVVDVAPGATSATFAVQPRGGAKPGEVTLAARAWLDGAPEVLGVDAPPVALIVK